jgi:hypothetical protein
VKAVVIERFGEPNVLQLKEVTTPSPGPDEVRGKVDAVAVARTKDVATRAGLAPFGPQVREFPHILGTEHTGIVDETGPGVDGQLLGQLGCWARDFASRAIADVNPRRHFSAPVAVAAPTRRRCPKRVRLSSRCWRRSRRWSLWPRRPRLGQHQPSCRDLNRDEYRGRDREACTSRHPHRKRLAHPGLPNQRRSRTTQGRGCGAAEQRTTRHSRPRGAGATGHQPQSVLLGRIRYWDKREAHCAPAVGRPQPRYPDSNAKSIRRMSSTSRVGSW